MEFVDKIRDNIYDTFADIDAKKGMRLVIIVGGYILIRNLAQRELAKRKLQSQVREDEKSLSEKKGENLIDRPREVASTATEFGWGNKTRKRVKKQEEVFSKMVERAQLQQLEGENDLNDIEDLLED
ncbi:hypothetical protein HG535_0G00690 [Zygotorulaspora mrakii]|uniref:Processing of GAS1 and ALP protein 2 n=1 Tax=Zygotorulaspora mrakii TaxID=42260 RepID=A0A7H9B631_ZYGMR|nr:uncharacterized protein HG535_0G00690 [Zygotorulaspora mrakii]QLG74185.1 hypothetical protein HG535_0G00690 [Zygotorulaspora mrakii]